MDPAEFAVFWLCSSVIIIFTVAWYLSTWVPRQREFKPATVLGADQDYLNHLRTAVWLIENLPRGVESAKANGAYCLDVLDIRFSSNERVDNDSPLQSHVVARLVWDYCQSKGLNPTAATFRSGYHRIWRLRVRLPRNEN